MPRAWRTPTPLPTRSAPLSVKVEERQDLLETLDIRKRLEKITVLLMRGTS